MPGTPHNSGQNNNTAPPFNKAAAPSARSYAQQAALDADLHALSRITVYNQELAANFILKGADVNAPDDAGTTPLMAAASNNNIDAVKFLLENGADVHYGRAHDGINALMYAAWGGHQDMVQYLLQAGAHVDAQMKNSETALSWMARWPTTHIDMMVLLMSHGADPHRITTDEATAMQRWHKTLNDKKGVARLNAAARRQQPETTANAADTPITLEKTAYNTLRAKTLKGYRFKK